MCCQDQSSNPVSDIIEGKFTNRYLIHIRKCCVMFEIFHSEEIQSQFSSSSVDSPSHVHLLLHTIFCTRLPKLTLIAHTKLRELIFYSTILACKLSILDNVMLWREIFSLKVPIQHVLDSSCIAYLQHFLIISKLRKRLVNRD